MSTTSHVGVCIPDAQLRSLFSLLLRDVGVNVSACPDLEQLQRVLTSRACQLCVLAQNSSAELPPAIALVRRLSPDTRILLIAAREEVDAVLPLFSQGVSDALLLPINPRRALDALHKLLAAPPSSAPAGATPSGSTPPWGGADAGAYRSQHTVARSAGMRDVLDQLWKARAEPLGVILRGEPGTEFELLAREYQTLCGDPAGYPVILGPHDVTTEGLANLCTLDRLSDGPPRTFFLPEVERLNATQQAQLLDFLRLARRRRERTKPFRMVIASVDCDESGRPLDCPFVEELLFVLSTVVRVPPLRERRDDIEPLARKLLLELSAIFPACRVRSLHPGTVAWLAAQCWRGNYREFCDRLRIALLDCASRELTPAHLGTMTDPESDPDEEAAARILAAVPPLGTT